MKSLKNFYEKKFKKFGPTPKGVGWGNKKKSNQRYQTLIKVLQITNFKKKISILDVGCGYGELIKYLPKNLNYSYTGIDIVEEMIEYAQKKYRFSKHIFFLSDITKLSKKYDFIICNGIFTLKGNMSNSKMKKIIINYLKIFHNLAKKGFVFNIMSEKVDFRSKILFYPKLDLIFKNLIKAKYSKMIIDSQSVPYEIFCFIKK